MIVIPMAGRSSRFTAAGYDRPKYELPMGSGTVFTHAVGGFSAYAADTPFLFIASAALAPADFIACEAKALGIRDWRLVELDQPTAGQAETVERGLDAMGANDAAPLTIFNIDTFRPGFRHPDADWMTTAGGYLEVFRGEGANWSYVRTAPGSDRVIETAEKRPISDLCCTGLYHFARAGDFRHALAAERAAGGWSELYVAPLYNHLIAEGADIRHRMIGPDEIIFCGVPDEYLEARRRLG